MSAGELEHPWALTRLLFLAKCTCGLRMFRHVRRVEAVVMSAGELEHEWAGTPGRMIRFAAVLDA